MLRISIISLALMLSLAMPAAAQKPSVEKVLTQLYGLCDRDYKPACIRLGLVIGRLPAPLARKLRGANPEWWWWERW